jgi:pyrroline-5-carboxylate reductase
MNYGFIGSGKMATALVQGAVESGALTREQIVVTDRYPQLAAQLAKAVGVKKAASNQEVARTSAIIVLCVKPGDVAEVLGPLQSRLAGKTLISIVAGLTISALQKEAGPECRVVRVMPNTPALVKQGAAAYALGSQATAEDGAATVKLFGGVGQIFQVKEDLLDAVTGLSGSGPAYVYLAIEALADGGVLMGLPRDLALKLAAQTVAGTAAMVLQSGQHPAALRDAVTSPGGTTAAGLEALEQHGARAAFLAAVRAATERARALGGK